jgi:hypothetical protein
MKQLSTSWKNESLFLPVLIIISVISHFPFILKGFGDPDSVRIATVVIDRINNGPSGPLAGYYFTDTIPLYVLYLSWVMRLLEYNYTYLPTVMNYTNAVFATLIVVPAYFLIKRTYGNDTVAFCSILVLIFNPTFYQSSIYGSPHLIAFFFFLVSLSCYLIWLDNMQSLSRYLFLMISSLCLITTVLLKSPIALAGGIYLGFLYMRNIKEKDKIILSFLYLMLSMFFFLLIRKWLIENVNTGTTSITDFWDWLKYFFGTPSIGFFKRQLKPLILGVGVLTTVLGFISFIYFLFRAKKNILIFMLSWVAIPYLFWIFVLGNNARYFMIGVLPINIMIVMFFYEKTHKLTIILTGALILGNFFITYPSASTYFPSGNLYKSKELLQDRTRLYHTKAKEIANIDYDKIAVMGYFHNPYVLYEILSSSPSYDAQLLTSVKGAVVQVKTTSKEYMICYIGTNNPEANIEKVIRKYALEDYIIVSATYNLGWLESKGLRTGKIDLLDSYHPVSSFSFLKGLIRT